MAQQAAANGAGKDASEGNWKKHTFAEATAVKAIDSHTYESYFPDDWCIGTGKRILSPTANQFLRFHASCAICSHSLRLLVLTFQQSLTEE